LRLSAHCASRDALAALRNKMAAADCSAAATVSCLLGGSHCHPPFGAGGQSSCKVRRSVPTWCHGTSQVGPPVFKGPSSLLDRAFRHRRALHLHGRACGVVRRPSLSSTCGSIPAQGQQPMLISDRKPFISFGVSAAVNSRLQVNGLTFARVGKAQNAGFALWITRITGISLNLPTTSK
jgi:hypothetical protein